MPERPILLFGEKQRAERKKKSAPPGKMHFPGKTRQIERLSPKFSSLQAALENGNLILQNSPNSIETEYTLVFEIVGSVEAFYAAVNSLNDGSQRKNTPGGYAEIVLDLQREIDSDADFYQLRDTGERADAETVLSKLYCVSTNGRALQELLSLWQAYTNNVDFEFPYGKKGLRAVFEQLHDIRQWGIQERLEETGAIEDWRGLLPYVGTQNIRCEIELFYSANPLKQRKREEAVVQLIIGERGTVLSRCLIDEIQYHALLVELPRQCIEKIVRQEDVALAKAEQIMFFRSTTGQRFGVVPVDGPGITHAPADRAELIEEPVIALFDGLPQENHPYLSNILSIDDPDNYAENYNVANRQHGTGMASLIAYGDLSNNTFTTSRKIYVRPIMRPITDLRGNIFEAVPNNILLVDKVHLAVRRLFEREDGEVAPTVKVINFSIGDSNRVFVNAISPLARLLDWLSYKYNVLFIVSAGNQVFDFDLGESFEAFSSKNIRERSAVILQYVNREGRLHRLISPAESMNALTVGSAFADFSDYKESPQQILPCESFLVDPVSALGKGINRSIKPDLIYLGGRNTIGKKYSGINSAEWRSSNTHAPGILSAAPLAAGSSGESYSQGTSNATALVTHEASRCYDILESLIDGGNIIESKFHALIIKAMLVHGAEWNDLLYQAYKSLVSDPRKVSDTVHKFFGYGLPDFERAYTCTAQKAIILGFGELKDGEADIFSLPLPFNFAQNKIYRRLTITLAYFSPMVFNRQRYRAMQLWATLENDSENWKRKDVQWQAALRGTLQHEIFENDNPEIWDEENSLKIKVNCRNDADAKNKLPIGYALMVSFEIKGDIDIDVYAKIANKIRPRVQL